MTRRRKTMGIMAMVKRDEPRFIEKKYYQKLTEIGRKQGIRVFVFSPRQADFVRRQVVGFEYRDGRWRRKWLPFPTVVYDRCFINSSYRHYKPFIERLQNDPKVIFMGRGLFGKWQVHQILLQSPQLVPYLPETLPYSMQSFLNLLKRDGTTILKPATGTHGAGVIRIDICKKYYSIVGRNHRNQSFVKQIKTLAGIKRFVRRFTMGRMFLVQSYLSLHTPAGDPYDVRVLVQKNGAGKWVTTGSAVRIGRSNITSNLHGGGNAVTLHAFLTRYFTEEKRTTIEQQIDEIVRLLPPFLEEHHGRLTELGIDIGIDTKGKVWIIEVNSKPGRSVFRLTNDRAARIRSVTLPVKYAQYLMKIV
ncbi:YheC/YheD family protein [Brevibacillus humidisoli]|uniref:YheC/YheD family endospore coat-associated protein n=1 Tax=Brevibacillus humidisoli TaxID=2895522 RepID=UPI001E52B9DC|nr:YheC/YheD family protein [Brevibacillus humidisoli]UFJ41509.1 YheC/YheD family protein [Brevibacillus humidisoli]